MVLIFILNGVTLKTRNTKLKEHRLIRQVIGFMILIAVFIQIISKLHLYTPFLFLQIKIARYLIVDAAVKLLSAQTEVNNRPIYSINDF